MLIFPVAPGKQGLPCHYTNIEPPILTWSDSQHQEKKVRETTQQDTESTEQRLSTRGRETRGPSPADGGAMDRKPEKQAALADLLPRDLLECGICLSLVCDPVSISCGHTFCRTCLVKTLQRSAKRCPCCRAVCHVRYGKSHTIAVAPELRACRQIHCGSSLDRERPIVAVKHR